MTNPHYIVNSVYILNFESVVSRHPAHSFQVTNHQYLFSTITSKHIEIGKQFKVLNVNGKCYTEITVGFSWHSGPS